MIKTKSWVIGIGVFLLICWLTAFALAEGKAEGSVANVYLDGKCVMSVDLAEVEKAETIELACGNAICMEPGRICVSDADCPDRICVKSGWLSDSSKPIVCLPNRLVIRLEKASAEVNAIDAVSQ